jgi:phage terminase small subunit
MPSGKDATLTVKEEKFVQELFKGETQIDAYKCAYNASKMKDKTIYEKACLLASKGKIRARLKELQEELKDRNMVTVEKVLNELSHIAFDDISNYLSYKTVKTLQGTDDEGEPIIGYQTVVDLKDSDTIDTRSIAEVSIGPNGTFKFKQYCKDNALVQIGKYLGMFTEKVEHSGKIELPSIIITK